MLVACKFLDPAVGFSQVVCHLSADWAKASSTNAYTIKLLIDVYSIYNIYT